MGLAHIAAMSTITSSREIDEVFREGTRVVCAEFIALIRRTPAGRGPEGRVAFIAGKRLGGAVIRNRAKRVMREAVKRRGAAWPGYDVALIARPKTANSSERMLDHAIFEVSSQIGKRP